MIWWVAAISMMVDHAGLLFYPDVVWMRWVGRMSYPLYGYLLAVGLDRSSDVRGYCMRLVVLAGIAAPVDWMVLAAAPGPVAWLAVCAVLATHGGVMGLVVGWMCVVAMYLTGGPWVCLAIPLACLTVRDCWGVIPVSLVASLSMSWHYLPAVLTIPVVHAVGGIDLPVPRRWARYAVYPVHLAVMGILKYYYIVR